MIKQIIAGLTVITVPFAAMTTPIMSNIMPTLTRVVGGAVVDEVVYSAAKGIMAASWVYVESDLLQLMREKQELASLPEEALIVKTQRDAQDNIDELLSDIFAQITDKTIIDYQETLDRNARNTAGVQKSITGLQARLGRALTVQQQEELQLQLTQETSRLNGLEADRKDIICKIRQRLGAFGVNVSYAQTETLLTKINGADILSMVTVFPVISEYTKYLAEITRQSGEDLATAKRYYSMHMMLLELQLYIQQQYSQRIEHEFIPELTRLKNETVSLMNDTLLQIGSSKGRAQAAIRNNLKSQEFTLKVINMYGDQLQSDLLKLTNASELVREDYKAAVNTYDTISLSHSVASLIEANITLFDEVMSLQTPDLITFENKKIQEEFERLTFMMGKGGTN